MTTPKPSPLIRAADRARMPDQSFSHPFNPASEIHGFPLGAAAGLSRVGVNLLRVPPGKESFVLHSHHGEEEFLYILSGRGMARIGDEEHEVGPGDFMGFPTPSVVHHLRNPFDEDLVYLSGGERKPMEVADLPLQNKRMVRVGEAISIYPMTAEETFPGMPPVRGR
jgi:uncharacterized cupin superfamily protein